MSVSVITETISRYNMCLHLYTLLVLNDTRYYGVRPHYNGVRPHYNGVRLDHVITCFCNSVTYPVITGPYSMLTPDLAVTCVRD